MKKKLFCIFITFVSLFVILCNQAFAVEDVSYDIPTCVIDATIGLDGSMDVTEWITQKGSFNGYYRDINYKGQMQQEPQGTKQDFYGCTLYNASGISDIKVFDFNTEIEKREIGTAFKQVRAGENGDSGVYELSETENGYRVKMYQESEDDIKGYAISYHIEDAIVSHNDVAELNWTFIGKEFVDDIEQVKIFVYLPGVDQSAKIWLRAPLESSISLEQEENNTYTFAKMSDLSSGTPMDVRIAFDKSLLTSCKKTTTLDALPVIVEVETERANDANLKREQTASDIKNALIVIALITVLFLLAALVIRLKSKKGYKVQFKGEYYRELPTEYDIEAVELLLKGHSTHLTLSATIMELARKNIIIIKPNPLSKDEFSIFLSDAKSEELKDTLNITENFVLDWFMDMGIDGGLPNTKLKKWSTAHAASFTKKTDSWKNKITEKYIKRFYEEIGCAAVIIYLIAWSLYLGIFGIMQFSNFEGNDILLFLFIMSLTVTFTAGVLLKRRFYNPCGQEEVAKMKAFKKFLLDFGRFEEKELPEIVLWGSYLSYATVLGIADKVEKAMKIQIDRYYNSNQYSNSFYFMSYASYTHSITNTTSSAYSSAYSSGSGSGGGGSSGGGSGGGGGGGGGF